MTATIKSLHESAMLIRVSMSAWSARKYDRAVSDEIASKHGTTAEHAGNYNKVLIAKTAIKKIQTIDNEIRAFVYFNTLPWFDDGFRILPAQNYFQVTSGLRDLKAKRESILAEFADSWPDLVAEAKARLNGLFDASDYPGVAEVMRRFGLDVAIMPLPNTSDFRADIDGAELAKLVADAESIVQAKIDAAMRDVWNRVHDLVTRMAERLRAYTVTTTADGKTKTENPFRDSLVENVRELAEVLPRLNFTGNPELADMATRLRATLCEHDAETLRTDVNKRETVARSASDILAAMAGYVGTAAAA